MEIETPWGPLGYVTYKRTYARRLNVNNANSKTEEFENTVDRIAKTRQDNLANWRWEQEFKQKVENDKILREKTKWDFMNDKKSDAKKRLLIDIEKELYSDINTDNMFSEDDSGNIVANPNAIDTLSGWEDKSSYGHIRNITNKLLESGDYGDVDLDYSTCLLYTSDAADE